MKRPHFMTEHITVEGARERPIATLRIGQQGRVEHRGCPPGQARSFARSGFCANAFAQARRRSTSDIENCSPRRSGCLRCSDARGTVCCRSAASLPRGTSSLRRGSGADHGGPKSRAESGKLSARRSCGDLSNTQLMRCPLPELVDEIDRNHFSGAGQNRKAVTPPCRRAVAASLWDRARSQTTSFCS